LLANLRAVESRHAGFKVPSSIIDFKSDYSLVARAKNLMRRFEDDQKASGKDRDITQSQYDQLVALGISATKKQRHRAGTHDHTNKELKNVNKKYQRDEERMERGLANAQAVQAARERSAKIGCATYTFQEFMDENTRLTNGVDNFNDIRSGKCAILVHGSVIPFESFVSDSDGVVRLMPLARLAKVNCGAADVVGHDAYYQREGRKLPSDNWAGKVMKNGPGWKCCCCLQKWRIQLLGFQHAHVLDLSRQLKLL
jgi:hypothetical protein